jgi:PTH1 family peptidyl-tRNA hydrolase
VWGRFSLGRSEKRERSGPLGQVLLSFFAAISLVENVKTVHDKIVLMALVIAGLGNPGKEYEKTRHNAGRATVALLAKKEGFPDFVFNKKANALVSEGKIGKEKVTLILPETYMNSSGKAVLAYVKSVKAAKNLLVVHDDLDLPLGVLKMVFERGAGGHKGVESIMRAIKTKSFGRLRVGISPVRPGGKGKKNQAKKVSGEEKVIKHVVGKWKGSEAAALKKALSRAVRVTRLFAEEGFTAAQQEANAR